MYYTQDIDNVQRNKVTTIVGDGPVYNATLEILSKKKQKASFVEIRGRV